MLHSCSSFQVCAPFRVLSVFLNWTSVILSYWGKKNFQNWPKQPKKLRWVLQLTLEVCKIVKMQMLSKTRSIGTSQQRKRLCWSTCTLRFCIQLCPRPFALLCYHYSFLILFSATYFFCLHDKSILVTNKHAYVFVFQLKQV